MTRPVRQKMFRTDRGACLSAGTLPFYGQRPGRLGGGADAHVGAGPTLERVTLPSGIPIDELDPGIRPQDDLFRHVNGRWIARTEIPADRARDSTFRALADQAENAMREIVTEAASAAEGRGEGNLGALHASFMDADRPGFLGSRPIGRGPRAARA